VSDPAAGGVVVSPLGSARFAVESAGQTRTAYAVRTREAAWVFLDGHVYVISAPGARVRTAATDERASLSAPMPATVVAVDVVPGQRVAAGEVLLRLEAMKMELPVRAPRDATVVAVKCREGELVQPGVPLLELDTPGPPDTSDTREMP
jgi:biotin carboxyl carrier protein